MKQYIDKDALVAEIENLENTYKKCPTRNSYEEGLKEGRLIGYKDALYKIHALEMKDSYEQIVQYDSIKAGIQAHAQTYSFNIESKLFNQLTEEQQKLWRKEIEQACISGGEVGVELARDTCYKENLEVKEVDLEKEMQAFALLYLEPLKISDSNIGINITMSQLYRCAKYFFELGLNAQQNINIDITNIDKVMEENGVDPNSKETKVFKESYYIALEKLKAKGE